MRKLGLNKAEAFTHFTKNQVGWNGFFGEMSEEFINIPLSNLINGNDLTEGFDAESIQEMAISIGSTSLAFGGGGVLYNKVSNSKSPTYYVDNQRFLDKKSAIARLNKWNEEGRINENKDKAIQKEYVAYEKLSKIIQKTG